MNGSTEHRASDPGERPPGRSQAVLNLGSARRMLPLVGRIVADLLKQQRLVDQLGPEQDRLDRNRRSLHWPERQRRYQVHEEFALAQRELTEARAELDVLGVALIDPLTGQIGLPTVVNGRLAYFSWKPGESGIQYWHFPGETTRRTVPASWSEAGLIAMKKP